MQHVQQEPVAAERDQEVGLGQIDEVVERAKFGFGFHRRGRVRRDERDLALHLGPLAERPVSRPLHSYDARPPVWTLVRYESHARGVCQPMRSEEQPSELTSLMRNSYAVFCL